MPRLNYGTLLENIVVLESTRLCLGRVTSDAPLGFATSFAMPPLTQCWCKGSEANGSPWFSYDFLMSHVAGQDAPDSLQGIWSLCLANAPNLPAWGYQEDDGLLLYRSAGPNGALLASMLAAHQERSIALWTNDDGGRYVSAAHIRTEGMKPDTLGSASALLGVEPDGTEEHVRGRFPETIFRVHDWLVQGAGRDTSVRIGFLDPDNYAEGGTQVSPDDHRLWLGELATGGLNVMSVMFSGCQNRGQGNAARNARLASFHSDEVDSYPLSLVFEYGTFQTGVKIRWPAESIDAVAADLRQLIELAWSAWHPALRPLTVHCNGRPSA